MQPERDYWPDWARFLHKRGWGEMVAALLEASGPLTIFLAQAMYIGQPFIQGSVPSAKLEALTRLFEDQDEGRSFASYLREDTHS
ncbi:MAG: hypothetical protein JW987_07980 [Anaerolineaceae bacterium]|nr:hypothetical protein [Anaerolineaceae bacterium]